MKKSICFLLCLTLVFSSVSLCFATPVSWDSNDSTHLTEIRNTLVSGGTIYNIINAINSNVVNLNSNLVTLMGWLDPSSGGSTNALLQKILGALTYVVEGSGLGSWLADIWQINSANLPLLSDLNKSLSNSGAAKNINAHTQMNWQSGNNYRMYNIASDGSFTSDVISWTNGSPLGNIAAILQRLQYIEAMRYRFDYLHHDVNWNATQYKTDWADLSSDSFTPVSSIDGIYKWFSYIQTPVARLSYVLASDERIAAQEAAAANEEAVVDNFIDSSGDGAASTSDISSVSDLSSGYKQNFGTNASPSGIFDIFNSDHATWFSQETKNQLDTTTPTRMSKGSESETPLLDKQIEDIYNALGVKKP